MASPFKGFFYGIVRKDNLLLMNVSQRADNRHINGGQLQQTFVLYFERQTKSIIYSRSDGGVSDLFPQFFSTNVLDGDLIGHRMMKWLVAVNINENASNSVVE